MSTPETPDKLVPHWLLNIKNIVLVAIGILTAINTYVTTVTKNRLDNQRAEMEQMMRKKEFENELRFKVFDEVKKAISARDSNMQEVVSVMIEEVLMDDSLFKERMKSVLLSSRNTSEYVKESIQKNEEFAQQEAEIQKTAATEEPGDKTEVKAPNPMRIDVFYLEDLPEGQKRAEKTAELLKEKYRNNSIQLRLLPRAVNARSGYRIEQNQIRYEANEESVATSIKELLDSTIMNQQNPIVPHKVQYHTPNYISVFVRN